MKNIDVAAPATHVGPIPSTVRHLLRWFAWGIPALPVAILVHELGHLAFYRLFGFPNLKLHFAAVSHDLHQSFWYQIRSGDFAAAAEIAPFYQVGIATGAAILISYGTILLCAYLTRKHPVHPFVVAVGLIAMLRFRIGTSVLRTKIFTDERYYSGTDEGLLAAVSGIPEVLLWAVGLSIAALGAFIMLREIHHAQRWRELVLLTVGVAVGAIAYITTVGPWLLPY